MSRRTVMRRLRASGMTLAAIGKAFGLSRERVRTILVEQTRGGRWVSGTTLRQTTRRHLAELRRAKTTIARLRRKLRDRDASEAQARHDAEAWMSRVFVQLKMSAAMIRLRGTVATAEMAKYVRAMGMLAEHALHVRAPRPTALPKPTPRKRAGWSNERLRQFWLRKSEVGALPDAHAATQHEQKRPKI